ncbi:SPOR domain-containing protein [Sulfurospirillum sp. 1612]|uniref:SPOR domain-containing protein n=1 Tax=Sulfurospirillum sp. 1612 TaxID=3094835 RepID=UPI002F922749
MENKNELSDIVLEKDNSKTLKIKRILIIIALLIIVFLGVLVTMKLVNKPTRNATPKLILPPEPKSTMAQPKDESLFKQVPIVEENTTKQDDFEKVVKNLKEKEIQKTKSMEQNTTTAPILTPKKKEKPVSTVVEPLKKAPVKTVKKTAKKVTPKATKSHKGIFVQVGAIAKTSPNQKFLRLIQSKKYAYILYQTSVNGKKVTKVLIGPYKSNQEAKNNLTAIKKSINKNAFIYRIK